MLTKIQLLLVLDYAEAYNNMSNIFLQQGKLDEAIEGFKKALLIRPNYAEAQNNLGLIYMKQKSSKEALGF